MNVVAITIISVVGTALFGMFFMQFQGLREDMKEGFRASNAEIKALDHNFTGELRAQGARIDRVYDVLRDHGERLARIEAKLEIDPPAEAA